MCGIAVSLIAALLYAAGRRIWKGLNDPLANAIEKTVIRFSKEKSIEISKERFEALLRGDVWQTTS